MAKAALALGFGTVPTHHLGSWATLSCLKNMTFEECFLGHKVKLYSGHI